MTEFFDELEVRSAEKREEQNFQILHQVLRCAKDKTPYFGSLLKGVDPSQVKNRGDLANLPITRKTHLLEAQTKFLPFGGMTSIPTGNLRRIFSSPGPIYDPQGTTNDYWRFARAMWAAGMRKGDVVHNTFSYHFTPAGFMVDEGGKKIGCAVFPAGTGQTEMQVRTIADIKPAAYAGTPSFLRIILEKAQDMEVQLAPSISKALVGGEALLPEFRKMFQERGIDVRQCYGTADLGLIAYETTIMDGLIVDEEVILEIVRPGTGTLVSDGEVGEVVVTCLNPEYPLIRYATGDLSAVAEGESQCGRTNLRIKGWMGRADQTTKVRGMFVTPKQIGEIQAKHPYLKRVRLTIEHDSGKNDSMTLFCETTQHNRVNRDQVATTLQDVTKLRGDVIFLKLEESLPNDGKVIEDKRRFD